jgi:uncharacterized protein (TIGR02001 family)
MNVALPRLLPVLLAALGADPIAHAAAEEAAPAPAATRPWSASVTLASQYVSRGIRQTWGRPAVQGGFDYAFGNGWSAGTFLTPVSERFVEGGRAEWDLYGGYAGTAGPFGYSLVASYYVYPGARISTTGTRFNYGEVAAGLTWRDFSVKYNHTVTRDFFGITNARGTGYLDLAYNHPLSEKLVLNLHAGEGRVAGAGNDYWNWRDIKLGVTRSLSDGWSVGGAYTRAYGATAAYDNYSTGVAAPGETPAYSNPAKGTLVLTLTKTF